MNRPLSNQPNSSDDVENSTQEAPASSAEKPIEEIAATQINRNNPRLNRVEGTPTMKVQS